MSGKRAGYQASRTRDKFSRGCSSSCFHIEVDHQCGKSRCCLRCSKICSSIDSNSNHHSMCYFPKKFKHAAQQSQLKFPIFYGGHFLHDHPLYWTLNAREDSLDSDLHGNCCQTLILVQSDPYLNWRIRFHFWTLHRASDSQYSREPVQPIKHLPCDKTQEKSSKYHCWEIKQQQRSLYRQ